MWLNLSSLGAPVSRNYDHPGDVDPKQLGDLTLPYITRKLSCLLHHGLDVPKLNMQNADCFYIRMITKEVERWYIVQKGYSIEVWKIRVPQKKNR